MRGQTSSVESRRAVAQSDLFNRRDKAIALIGSETKYEQRSLNGVFNGSFHRYIVMMIGTWQTGVFYCVL